MQKKSIILALVGVLTFEAAATCDAVSERLFNGRDLSGWYTFLKGRGRNVDPKGVFSVTNGVIRITGEEFGALVTEKEYSNYRLSLDYRFLGGEQFGGKAGWAPDSGILFHSTGPDGGFAGIWMESVEVNLIKGATGDFWGVGKEGSDRISLSAKVGTETLGGKYAIHDPNGKDVYTIRGNARVCRQDIARDWTDTTGVALAGNENPIGEWNRVELVCSGDEVIVNVNGKTVNRGFGVKPTAGRIQLQSEGCAIEFRNIQISPLKNRPGVCAHVTRDEFAERKKAFGLMRKAGIDYVRCDFDWRWYQKTKDGPIDWRKCDAVVDDAAAFGIRILPILFTPPDWAKPVQNHIDIWRTFVRETARHFKGRIPVYEIWNEENHPGFWPNPNAADYVPVLRAAYEEIKATDPAARVAIGGTAGCDLGYLKGVYKAGGKPFFDIMNVHPYCWPNPPDEGLPGLFGQLRALMAKYGDAQKPVWVTEVGWPTHQATIPTPGLFTAGLKISRPNQVDWRIGCVGNTDDVSGLRATVDGIRKIVSPGSTVKGYTADGLNAALESNELDVVVYPFDESFPLRTLKHVARFVKAGGVLVDFGGSPMYYPRENGALREKTADGNLVRDLVYPQFRFGVYGPNAANGLVYNGKSWVTQEAQDAGMKYEPEGVKVFRFFTAERLKDGDRMIPLLSVKDKNGQDAAGACVYKFDSDLKGAIVLSGSGTGRCGSTEREQAENVVKMLAVSEKCGIGKTFFYEFRASEKDDLYSEDHYGIVHRDLSPKPAYERLRERMR